MPLAGFQGAAPLGDLSGRTLPPGRTRSYSPPGVCGRQIVRSDSEQAVAVIGGGISGITTAILLQLTGHSTAVYTKRQPSFEPDADRPPEFATLHAAASVIP